MRGSGLDIGPHCPNGSTQKCVMSLICIKLNQTKQSSVRLSGSVRPSRDARRHEGRMAEEGRNPPFLSRWAVRQQRAPLSPFAASIGDHESSNPFMFAVWSCPTAA